MRDVADSGILSVFGCLLLFLKRAAENQFHGSLRIGGGMKDEAVIFFQLWQPNSGVAASNSGKKGRARN